ncbi:hypothetical protein A3768_0306 [Ralstonia solanacearum]|nr:hypothetical protein A3768_0306 [Ralstonia solanacearum]
MPSVVHLSMVPEQLAGWPTAVDQAVASIHVTAQAVRWVLLSASH